MKRLLSCALAILLVFSLLPSAVFAAENEAPAENETQAAIVFGIEKTPCENGSFTVSADGKEVTEAAAGTTVTLAATAAEGCSFEVWTVTDENGDPVEVTENSFIMPAYTVTVEASFVSEMNDGKTSVTETGAPVKVSYLNAAGVEDSCTSFTEINSSNKPAKLTDGWYVVDGIVSYKSITVNGKANLILKDNASLTLNAGTNQAGISVKDDSAVSLTVYAQSTGSSMGKLTVTGGENGAGIGGGNGVSAANITIIGGYITANGGKNGAGIGGGNGGSASKIVINGGIVLANGGTEGAGIGGANGGSGSSITVNGGSVMAKGGSSAAGIGGSFEGNGSSITVNGGSVTAIGGENAAGIGGGMGADGESISVGGGMVKATGGKNAGGIGGGKNGNASKISVALRLTLLADSIDPPVVSVEHTDSEDISAKLSGKTCVLAQLDTKYYTVYFSRNGSADKNMDTVSYQIGTSNTLPACVYKRAGYVFTGWNTAEDGSGTAYADKASVKDLTTSGKTIRLFAQWKPISYTIHFGRHGSADVNMKDVSCKYDELCTLEKCTYSRTGYTFEGWNTKEDGTGIAITDEASIKNLTTTDGARVTIFAQWKPITYTIHFSRHGAANANMADILCEYDADIALPQCIYSYENNLFTGWNTKEDGSGTAINDMATVRNLSTVDGAVVRLFAQWETASYKIHFGRNGSASTSMDDLVCQRGKEYKLPKCSYERTGYIFTGWNTMENGKGYAYADELTIKNLTTKNGETVTLYAQWKPITYTVHFGRNGYAGANMTDLTGRAYDTTYILSKCTYVRDGYIFKGWNTKPDGTGTAYVDKGSFKNLTATDGASVTLFAQWQAKTYTISFNANGSGSAAMSSLSCVAGKEYTLPECTFKRTGYTFKGWTTNPNGTGTLYSDKQEKVSLTVADGATVVLYAKWEANHYSVRFARNGGVEDAVEPQVFEYGKAGTLKALAYTYPGHVFTGWNTARDGSGKAYANKATVMNLTAVDGKVVELCAQWRPIKYTIHFNGNGSFSEGMADKVCEYDTAYTLKANTYTREGYTFTGWNTKANGTGEDYTDMAAIKNITQVDGKEITLYAQWKVNTYTIRFGRNGSSDINMNTVSCQYGKTYKLENCTYSRTGYIFTGWNTRPDGKGTAIENMAQVSNLTTVDGEVVALYAQWKPIEYTIAFNGNGAPGAAMESMTGCKYGESYTLSKNTYTHDGYTFICWTANPDGSGKAYLDLASVKNLVSVDGGKYTLYAKWETED